MDILGQGHLVIQASQVTVAYQDILGIPVFQATQVYLAIQAHQDIQDRQVIVDIVASVAIRL